MNALVWLDKPFKFFHIWVKHRDFMTIVAESWHDEVEGDSMMKLFLS